MNFRDKTAWITGASSGIGEAIAIELFNQGANLILTARSTDKLDKLKAGFDKIETGRCVVIPCDITKPSSIEKAIESVIQSPGRVDILVNNAGVSQRSLAMETTLATDRNLFEVNFFGTITLTKGILPLMISKGGGHIIVMSSMAGKFGFRMRSSYSASKHALHGFFETLRSELHGNNIHVTLVCPGRVKTDISIHSLTGNGDLYGKMDKGQENGTDVTRCARRIVRAVRHDRKEIYIGVPEFFLLSVKRVCPPLFYLIANHASPT